MPTVRILSLGDSYTIGESVEPSERWPVQLAERLRQEGWAVDAPRIIARTGWRSDELLAALQREQPAGPFDLVTLLVGVNNQYQHGSLAAYRADLRLLLAAAQRLGPLLALSIPDWGVTPFAAGRDRTQIGQEIDAFNAAKQAEVQRAGAQWIDITPISRQAVANLDLLAQDGLHPSGKMYALWVQAALPALNGLLRGPFA